MGSYLKFVSRGWAIKFVLWKYHNHSDRVENWFERETGHKDKPRDRFVDERFSEYDLRPNGYGDGQMDGGDGFRKFT